MLILSLGILAMLLHLIEYLGFFKKSYLYLPKTESSKVSFRFMRTVILLIIATGWGFLLYSFTEPKEQMGYSKSKIDANDIYFVVDLSRSMLANDLPPNRLEVSKRKIREFIALRPSDRLGIVIFAEKVFTLLPLTTDYSLLDSVVGEIEIGFLGNGTNIGDALALATARLKSSLSKTKIIILLTDGVSNVGIMTPNQAAEEAKKENIKIYSIGVGGADDAQIPLLGSRNRYQNIPGGSIDFETLESISQMTGGKSFVATSEKSLKTIFSEIDQMEKTQIEKTNIIQFKELYYTPFIIGLLLFVFGEFMRRFVLKDVT